MARLPIAYAVVVALLVAGCSPSSSKAPSPTPAAASASAVGESASATPSDGSSATPSGSDSGLPTPGDSGTPSVSASATPTGPVSCTTVAPIRVGRVDVDPRRATEVVTVQSDGNSLTSGTREQFDFTTPGLTGPDGTVVSDDPTLSAIARLIGASRHRVLLTRPDAPDDSLNPNKKPFNAPGRYVVYNASAQLRAEIVVLCSGQQQNWSFVAEGDPTTGQVNCAVEPARSSALAHLIYQNNC